MPIGNFNLSKMSIRLEMIQVARLAPKMFGESAGLVRSFLMQQLHTEGGFKDRQGNRDLYYTVFGLDGLQSLGAMPMNSNWHPYIQLEGARKDLDFVHLCCLIRCLSIAPEIEKHQQVLLDALMKYRSKDGGFQPELAADHGTAYGAFLAVGALQDLGVDINTVREGVSESLKSLQTSDGAWGNDRKQRSGATNATAAVMTTLRQFGISPDPDAALWLVGNCHPMGGFLANSLAPVPDLLSTATSLHALSGMQFQISDAIRERCLDFVDTLWTNEGSFHGHWHEDELDTEYTFYGLLALGHLSV